MSHIAALVSTNLKNIFAGNISNNVKLRNAIITAQI
jgi:hypothetical protein